MADQTQDTTAAKPDAAAAVDAAAAPIGAAAGSADTQVPPAVPESYPLTMPDGTRLAPEAVARITEKAKSLKVADPTLAQAMLDVAHGEVSETIAAYEAAHKEGGAAWQAMVQAHEQAALAHPEIGNGSKQQLEQKALQGALVLNRYAPEAMPSLKAAGLLNEPSVLLLLNRIYDATREKPMAQGSDSKPPEKQKSYEERIYGAKQPA